MKREWVLRTCLLLAGIAIGTLLSIKLSSRFKMEGGFKRIDTWTGAVWILESGKTYEYKGEKKETPPKWVKVIEP